jgi:hypothetical protein
MSHSVNAFLAKSKSMKRTSPIDNFIVLHAVGALILAIAVPRLALPQHQWIIRATGAGAGSWFTGTWSTGIVPYGTDIAVIANSGKKAASGTIPVLRLEVGKDTGAGILTSAGDSISVADFDDGEIGVTFAMGPITVNSNSAASISHVTSVAVGVSGVGDLDIGQTGASLGAVAVSTESLSIPRTQLLHPRLTHPDR